jgi:hypothetical protein
VTDAGGGDSRRLLLEALEMLGRSARRLEDHRRTLAPLTPLDAGRLEGLSELELTRVEAMLRKFGQMVDDLRRRAFRGVLVAAAEPVEGMNVRQMLERLAALGAIPSAESFIAIMDLRNQLAHEYPKRPDLQAAQVTKAWRAIPELLGFLDGVRRYAVDAGLVAAVDLPPR